MKATTCLFNSYPCTMRVFVPMARFPHVGSMWADTTRRVLIILFGCENVCTPGSLPSFYFYFNFQGGDSIFIFNTTRKVYYYILSCLCRHEWLCTVTGIYVIISLHWRHSCSKSLPDLSLTTLLSRSIDCAISELCTISWLTCPLLVICSQGSFTLSRSTRFALKATWSALFRRLAIFQCSEKFAQGYEF